MLTIDLRHLSQGPIEAAGEIRKDDPLLQGAEVELAEPLAVRVRAEATTARSIWVRGSLKGRVRAGCRRCLQPLNQAIGEEFSLLFDPRASKDDEDLTLYSFDPRADELDLRDPVREQFLLAISAFPLCRDDCRGLCAHCGSNLNEGECGCEAVETDPRWAPLLASPGDAMRTTDRKR